MPLRSLDGHNAQAAYEATSDMLEFLAELIARTEDIPIDEARQLAQAEAEQAYYVALAFD